MKLTIVTSNPNKAREIAAFFKSVMEITHVSLDLPEHRSDAVEEIARRKADYAYGRLRIPLIVDDTSFCVRALSGFPGPYAAYVLEKLGNSGILKLMEGHHDRFASFKTAIAYADEYGVQVFSGLISGLITVAPKGEGGFGYDSIFEYNGRTLAELLLEEKTRISHRAQALAAFRDWFIKRDLSVKSDKNR